MDRFTQHKKLEPGRGGSQIDAEQRDRQILARDRDRISHGLGKS